MDIAITNFRGLADLRTSAAPILLLAGANGAGKTSACAAIAAAASGSLLPFDGLTKKAAGLLVRDGADLATVLLEDGDDGRATASWPATERGTGGAWRDISSVAAGLDDVAALKPAERAAVLIDLIGATPSADDLRAAMAEREVGQLTANKAVELLARGWDAAHTASKEQGAKLKGRWEQVTGFRYGKQKVIGWRPDGWQPRLEGVPVKELEAAVAAAESALAELRKRVGATEADMAAWSALAEGAAGHEAGLRSAQAEHQAEVTRAAALAEELSTMGARPSPGAEPLTCPCCGKAVRLRDGALQEANAGDFAELAEGARAWDKARAEAVRAAERRDMAQRYVLSAERKLEEARDAAAKLAAAQEVGGSASEAEIEEASAALAAARGALDMRIKVNAAAALAETIQHVHDVTELLDKNGLRQAKLAEALGDFNGLLVELCGRAGWLPVHVDADMAVSYGGRPISLCSAGEQYRARVSLQLAIATCERAALVVIDGADILDKAGRNGLFRVLGSQEQFRAVIGMTLSRREELPDLRRAGVGESVWIESGRAAPRVREAA